MLIVAPISDVEPATGVTGGNVTCGICGFAMNEAGECASPVATVSCKLEIAERAREYVDTGEERDVASPAGDGDQVADWLDETNRTAGDDRDG